MLHINDRDGPPRRGRRESAARAHRAPRQRAER